MVSTTRRSFNISDLLESNKTSPAIAGSPPTPGEGGGDGGLLGTGKANPGTSLSTPTTIGESSYFIKSIQAFRPRF